jgi:hypothetical protein
MREALDLIWFAQLCKLNKPFRRHHSRASTLVTHAGAEPGLPPIVHSSARDAQLLHFRG